MSAVALAIGIALPALLAWLAITCLEGQTPVLQRFERIALATALGPTLLTLLAFACHWAGLTRFTLLGFLLPLLAAIVFLLAVCWRRKLFGLPSAVARTEETTRPLRGWMKVALAALVAWTALKIVAGAFDLASVPTYWDDSFNNWNMRGKIFYHAQELELTIPLGNGIVQDASGTGSYPILVPLTKAWLSTVRGGWVEAVVNGVHAVWFLTLIALLFLALKREVSRTMSIIGTYLFVALPLVLIHGSNPYAEIAVAVHLFAAIHCLYRAWRAPAAAEASSWLRLAAFAAGLLTFTKNEGTVLYLPLLVALGAWVLADLVRTGRLDRMTMGRAAGTCAAIAAVLVLPWLSFKWMNGLSFGNAKNVSDTVVRFHSDALYAVWFHFSHEANWLLLPLLLPLLILVSGKRAWKLPIGMLTAFVCAAFIAQMSIFVFTNLATEAVRQTGISRGVVQIAPVIAFLFVLLGNRLVARARGSDVTA